MAEVKRGRGRPKKAPTPPQPHVTSDQLRSLKTLDNALMDVLSSYRNLMHPSIEEVIALDNAVMVFHHHFCEQIHDQSD